MPPSSSPAPVFVSSGLVAYYPLTEGSGTTLKDASGHGYTSSITGTTIPTWTTDNALSYTTSTSATALNSSVQGIQTVEIAVAGLATFNSNAVQVITDYSGANPAMSLSTFSNYNGGATTNVPTMGYTDKWLAYHIINSSQQYAVAAVVDNGLHILTESYNSSTGAVVIYLDGQVTVLGDQSPSNVTGTLPTSGAWYLGNGEPIGTSNCGGFCSFAGKIYGIRFYTGVLTAGQVQQDYYAWLGALQAKGVNTAQSGSNGYTNPLQLVSMTESIGWGHGLGTPGTQNYVKLAATSLSTALSQTVTPVVDGNDSNNAYIMSIECVPQHTAYKSSIGTNIAIIDDNFNAARLAGGYLSGVPQFPGVSTISAAVWASVNALSTCIQSLHQQGWKVIVGTGISALSAAEDTAVKDVAGPIYRQYLTGVADGLWNMQGDARWGADSAGLNGASATTCSGGATYQSDLIHPTACGQVVLAAQLTTVVEAALNKPTPPTHVSSSTTYTMAGTDVYATLNISGSAAAITTPMCAGLENGAWITINNTSGGSQTLTGATETNGGAQDNINGSTSATLSTGTRYSYQVLFTSDTAGGCSWVTR